MSNVEQQDRPTKSIFRKRLYNIESKLIKRHLVHKELSRKKNKTTWNSGGSPLPPQRRKRSVSSQFSPEESGQNKRSKDVSEDAEVNITLVGMHIRRGDQSGRKLRKMWVFFFHKKVLQKKIAWNFLHVLVQGQKLDRNTNFH